MSTYSRPNGNSDFTDDPKVDPATGAKFDAELNGMIAILNSLDNGNISGSPKIAASKIDLASGGYVNDTGDEMTGALEHIFDGNWRKMRASGNARIYEGVADGLWCLSYNSEYSSGSWQGRDTTGVCINIKLESDGFHVYTAVSASSGTVPTWVSACQIDMSGNLNLSGVVGTTRVVQDSIANDAVGQAELKSSAGSVSTIAAANLTLPGGTYGFYPQIKMSGAVTLAWEAHIITGTDTGWTGYVTNINLEVPGGGSTIYAQQRYINASPPYNLGNGDIPLFIFAMINNSTGKIDATYIAEDPPWAYNGPKRVNPNKVIIRKGKKYLKRTKRPWSHTEAKKNRSRFIENIAAAKAPIIEEVELTHAIKNAGMPDIPHPFASLNPTTHTVVLLDPVSSLCLDLYELSKDSDEGTTEISEILYEGRIKFGNTAIIGLITPPGVLGVKMRLG